MIRMFILTGHGPSDFTPRVTMGGGGSLDTSGSTSVGTVTLVIAHLNLSRP